MKLIPPGTFKLGDTLSITLASYCLDGHEVTVSEYARCVDDGACAAPSTPDPAPRPSLSCNWGVDGKDDHPINCVTWQQAQNYCSHLHKTLPSEAQWEYAARGGSLALPYPWGDTFPSSTVACWDPDRSRSGTCSVASHPSTSYGLHDMAGNVSEWVVVDDASYPHPSAGARRISRGGAWLVMNPMLLHGIVRSERPMDYHGDAVGFRCAASPRGT